MELVCERLAPSSASMKLIVCSVTTTNQLRTQLSQLQTTHHTSSSELNVIQMRIEVSCVVYSLSLTADGLGGGE